MDIAYYPGCTLESSAQLYDAQNRMVFDALGIHLKEIEDWNCCGATSAGKIDDFLAVAMPARNLGIAEAYGRFVAICLEMSAFATVQGRGFEPWEDRRQNSHIGRILRSRASRRMLIQ